MEDYAKLNKKGRAWLSRHRKLRLEPNHRGRSWKPLTREPLLNRLRVYVLTATGALRLLSETKLKEDQT